jgi:hypothetical protein
MAAAFTNPAAAGRRRPSAALLAAMCLGAVMGAIFAHAAGQAASDPVRIAHGTSTAFWSAEQASWRALFSLGSLFAGIAAERYQCRTGPVSRCTKSECG